GADAGNYTVNASASTTADITPKALTGTIIVADKVYNGDVGATITERDLTGVVDGDDVTYTGGIAEFINKNVGDDKAVNATGLSDTGDDAGNYTVNTSASTTADITPKTLVGTIEAANKVYDGTTDATITERDLTGVVDGDDVSYVGGSATFNNKNVG